MRRILAATALLGSLAGTAFAQVGVTSSSSSPAMETDIYRAANTYHSVRATGTQACADACAADTQCKAWTVTPPTFRLGPRCEFKSSAGRSEARPGYISGLSSVQEVANRPPTPIRRSAVATVTTPPPLQPSVRTGAPADAPQPRPTQAEVTGGGAVALSHFVRPPVTPPTTTAGLSSSRSSSVLAGGLTGPAQSSPPEVDATDWGPVARSHFVHPPVTSPNITRSPAQPSASASRVAPFQQTGNVAATAAQPQAPARPAAGIAASTQPTAPPVKRTVTRTIVAKEPPAMIARPSSDAAGNDIRLAPAESQQERRPASATSRQTSQVTTPRASQARPPLPTPSERQANLEQLPSPLERDTSLYSVQRMGQFPGDHDATAGYVEGLPENAKVEAVPRSGDEEPARSEKDNKSRDSDNWSDEYPDPLGGPIGSEPLSPS